MSLADFLFDHPEIYNKIIQFYAGGILHYFSRFLYPEDYKAVESCPVITQRSIMYFDRIAEKTTLEEFIDACIKDGSTKIAENVRILDKKTTVSTCKTNYLIFERRVFGERLDAYLKENPKSWLIKYFSKTVNNNYLWYIFGVELSSCKPMTDILTYTWLKDIQNNCSTPQEEAQLFLERLAKICPTKCFFDTLKKENIRKHILNN